MEDSFLGRWSRRKTQVREGQPVAEPPPVTVAAPAPALAPIPQPEPPAETPPPTLQDALDLTTQSDFKPFMARNVAPEVKNAAMKKLFTDPHFNVMDMMDVYVDDYSLPDPMPESMLRQLASSQFLKLFDDEDKDKEKTPDAATPRDDADAAQAQSVAQLETEPQPAAIEAIDPKTALSQPAAPAGSHTTDDHPDLRLQPNDATQRQSAEPGPG